MRVLISGATGLIGSHLGRLLAAQGHECWGLSRRARQPDEAFKRWFAWDTLGQPLPAGALAGVDAVVHLAGEPVGEGRWTHERKRRIRDSRVLGTRALVAAMAAGPDRPKVLVAASAVGYYGDRGEAVLHEEAPPGKDFLAEVCVEWERESAAASELGIRVAQHRIGIVLAREGGALAKMLTPFKLGVGGRLGSGKQYFPWVHLDDAVGLLTFSLEHEVRGPVNTVAPHQVTNREFTETLARVLHRPAFAAVPKLALQAALGELAGSILMSQRASADHAVGLGYGFKHPMLGPALQDLLGAK